MTRKYLTVRREKTRQLAEREAAARCGFKGCQLPLSRQKRDAGVRFCDDFCADAAELDATREARR